MSAAPMHVLVIDDSAVVRHTIERFLLQEPGWRVSAASDGIVALDRLRKDPPDVIILDLEMPRLDGLSFLRHLMATQPIPVVVCSAYAGPGTAIERVVLDSGAIEIISKPSLAVKDFLEKKGPTLADRLRRAAAQAPGLLKRIPSHTPHDFLLADMGVRDVVPQEVPLVTPAHTGGPRTILLGASMGGPAALRRILTIFPDDAPPCLVVQHMQGTFTRDFARRLDEAVRVEVREAEQGDTLVPGRVLVAPGDHHLVVRASTRGEPVLDLTDDPPFQGHRPSVDVLFRSAARVLGPAAVAAVLTGTGRDGAEGLLELRRAGARTFVQHRDDATAYGMPQAALAIEAAERAVPLDALGRVLVAMALGVDNGVGATRETESP